MGSLGGDGGDDDEIKPTNRNSSVDLSDTETVSFDSQFSPQSLSGGKFKGDDTDDLQFLQNTVPFDDIVPVEDVFETQVVNLCGETQALDNLDCTEYIDTQLLDDCDTEVVDSDGEGTDRTEVLCDTEELSDDDSMQRVDTCPVDQENILHTTLPKQGDGGFKAESDAVSNEERSTGSLHREFTSVHAASIPASGLAARKIAFKGTNSGLCSVMSGNDTLKQLNSDHNGIPVIRCSSKFEREVDQENTLGEYDEQMKGLRNDSKHRFGRSTVRKLFTEDTHAEIKGLDDNMNNADGGADLHQWFASGNELAGLSYVDSQEPGELSQANALDFVDRFLKVNVIDIDQEDEIRKFTGGRLKPVSCAKGTQSLAKSASLISKVGERGIFDWDDNREDERGGEFFRKKKEALFDNGSHRQRSFTQPRKPKRLDSKSGGAVKECRDKEEQLEIHDKVMGLVHSDSRLMYHNPKLNDKSTKETEVKFRKNLIKELDEQLNIGCNDGMVETGTGKDMPEMLNIGFDTQMAAEAMEALCFGVGRTDHDCNDDNQGAKNMQKSSPEGGTKNRNCIRQTFLKKRAYSSNSGIIRRQSKQAKRTATKFSKESPISSQKRSVKVRNQCDGELIKAELKRAKSDAKEHFTIIENLSKVRSKIIEQTREEKAPKRSDIDEIPKCHKTASSGRMSVKKRCIQEQLGTFTPIACRTRQSMAANQSKRGGDSSGDIREGMNVLIGFGALKSKRKRSTDIDVFAEDKSTNVESNKSCETKKTKLTQLEQPDPKLSAMTSAVKIDVWDYPRRRRTCRKLSSVGQEANGRSIASLKKSQAISTCVDLGIKRKTWSSVCAGPVLPFLDRQSDSGERLFQRNVRKGSSKDISVNHKSVDINGNAIAGDVVEAQAYKNSMGKSVVDITSSAEGKEAKTMLEASPGDRFKPSASACTTPVNCVTPINEASPICMGDEYLKQSCRKNLSRSSLMKEIDSLTATGPELTSAIKDSRRRRRRRRDMANVQVLFSRHLDEDIIKQLKKILSRLGASVAPSISDASHFIADKFVRTRNMLEAIAFGKPVVTHLWLESCGQANCVIDERNYILRDAKKEKEFGFSLPVSLARACQHPLLQGQRVLITPNTKPGKEILASLVKAVHGVAVDGIERSALKDDKISDLLVLSCEEDYGACVPFLEKGTAVYSSELLMNGIVTQKLEYERHLLFVDHVKRTRSTTCLKKR